MDRDERLNFAEARDEKKEAFTVLLAQENGMAKKVFGTWISARATTCAGRMYSLKSLLKMLVEK